MPFTKKKKIIDKYVVNNLTLLGSVHKKSRCIPLVLFRIPKGRPRLRVTVLPLDDSYIGRRIFCYS